MQGCAIIRLDPLDISLVCDIGHLMTTTEVI